jgi:hypothetical protein
MKHDSVALVTLAIALLAGSLSVWVRIAWSHAKKLAQMEDEHKQPATHY